MFIDISKHNSNDIKDWNAIKKSVEGIIIRCGYRGYGSGKIVADPQYNNYAKMCIKHNIPFGVYFMSQAITISEGMEEAEYAVKSALRHSATIPLIIIDSEDGDGTAKVVRADGLSQNERTEICKAFCEKANELGFVGGVYASESWFKNRLHYDRLKQFYIWCAKYGVNDGKQHTKPDLEKVDMWQYSSHGKCAGINDRVDVNIMYTKPKTNQKEKLPSIKGYTGYSITEALRKNGYESSFNYRNTIWKELGKSETYKGTADQNLEMIRLLGGNVKTIPSLKGYKGFSIVQGLKNFGYKSDFKYRSELWEMIGKTSKYKGSATQNLTLLNYLKSH